MRWIACVLLAGGLLHAADPTFLQRSVSAIQPRADDLTTGRFRIRSRAQAKVTSDATATQVGRARAFLEVNGTRHPLQPPSLVVGRGTDADLRINDPGVSRRHVEFFVTGGGSRGIAVEVHDLGSTNGMLVDGHRIQFRVSALDGTQEIGRGTHGRVVIDLAKFVQRLESR